MLGMQPKAVVNNGKVLRQKPFTKLVRTGKVSNNPKNSPMHISVIKGQQNKVAAAV